MIQCDKHVNAKCESEGGQYVKLEWYVNAVSYAVYYNVHV